MARVVPVKNLSTAGTFLPLLLHEEGKSKEVCQNGARQWCQRKLCVVGEIEYGEVKLE